MNTILLRKPKLNAKYHPKSLVRLISKSILSTLKAEKVLKTRLKSSKLHELVLTHGKSSNRKAANLNQYNIRLQIHTNVSPAEMEESTGIKKEVQSLKRAQLVPSFCEKIGTPIVPWEPLGKSAPWAA